MSASDQSVIHSEFNELAVFEKRHSDNFADEEDLKLIEPYLIPEGHRMKAALDAIFSKGGVLKSPEAMKTAGFKLLLYRTGRGLVVAKHPLLKNYLVKTYLDSATHVDWTSWVRRAKGARLVQACIDAKPRSAQYTKVPQKWIYHIPLEARGKIKDGNLPREFLLLVEDMRLVSKEKNEELYKTFFSEKSLQALYYVVNKSGYSDCHIGNLPFSTDGKIAFIDTEYTNIWPVHPQWLTKWFSPKRQVYWEKLF
ncbi:MAG: hypothetical protein H0W50_02540 [Parachlamydiaceae bacterium]|nr:hypothetical protein [Parachlamydiaceae bacterium]